MMPNVFAGVIPALMTPCKSDRTPDFDALVRSAGALIDAGMSGVVYCGSMGEWPLLSIEDRKTGVERLVAAGVPVVVGTGASSPAAAVSLAEHARSVGATGLMVIPRVLSRSASVPAQRAHFEAILRAADPVPAVIYNSPYYGYETKADLFFDLRERFSNLVGFKEFGGAEALRYAAEFIIGADPSLMLLVGVDTQVFHGYVNCGAVGTITGIGNVLPREVLHVVRLCEAAKTGNAIARTKAQELEQALRVLSSFDEGVDLVLYYKYLMCLEGHDEYAVQMCADDTLTPSQKGYAEKQLHLFKSWYSEWSVKD